MKLSQRMRRYMVLILAAAVVMTAAVSAAAADGDPAAPPPSLEYRPPRAVIPEPKAPHPLPPKTVFAETVGSFGIMTGSFDRPVDVARDKNGNYYVLDSGNSRVQKFGSSGKFLTSWGSVGSRLGQFNKPSTVVVGPFGDLDEAVYVVDTGNDRVQVFAPKDIDAPPTTGLKPIRVIGEHRGSWPGDFKAPLDVTIAPDRDGEIYVLDSGNERVQRFDKQGVLVTGPTFELRGGVHRDVVSIAWLKKGFGSLFLLGPGCLVQQFKIGPGGQDAALSQSFAVVAPESGLCEPARIRVDKQYLYVLDSGNDLLMCFDPDIGGMFRWALRGARVPFSGPLGFTVNFDGDEMLVADTDNNFVQKFTLR